MSILEISPQTDRFVLKFDDPLLNNCICHFQNMKLFSSKIISLYIIHRIGLHFSR